MKLGLMKLKNTLNYVSNMSAKYDKPLMARVPAVADGTGVSDINASTLKLNVNVNWKPDMGRYTMPTDIDEYKRDFRHGYYKQLTHVPYITSVQNEMIPWGTPYTPEMMVKMVKFHAVMNPNNLVSHSATEPSLLAGMTKHYLAEIGDTKRLDIFNEQWSMNPNALWTASDDKVALAVEEIERLAKAALPNFIYTLHMNAKWENLPCLPVMIETVRHYIDCPIAFNELSFFTQEAQLVTDWMNKIKSVHINTVIGFTSERSVAVEWTDEMLAAFVAFA